LKATHQNSFSIFLWHHPADKDFAIQLAGDLCSRGFEVTALAETKETNPSSVDTAGWRMAKSNCVVFLLSETTVMSASLQMEAEKVMRRKDALLIPAYLNDLKTEDLPLLLQYIQPMEFYRDYPKALDSLVDEIHRKIQGEPSTLREANQPWARLIRWIIEHYRRYLTLSPLTFCWQITVENLIISLAVTGLIYLIWQPPPRTNLQNITASTYLWSIIILGPILETILLQAIPVFIARFLGLKFFGQLLFSIVPFAALHFTRSIGAGIGAGIIGGFYSAFTYIHWQSKSTWTAFWVTAFSHCLYNLALFAMLIGEF
jgi:hypothetical protein